MNQQISPKNFPKPPENKIPEDQNKIPEDQNKIREEKRKRINEKRRERRRRQKEEGVKSRAEEDQKQRQKQKEKDPEYTARESRKRQERRQKTRFLEKQKRISQNRENLNSVFDKLFEENKHTFPTPVSKNQWEKLKQDDFNFLFYDEFFLGDNTIKSLMEDREELIEFLQNDLDNPCAPSIIFYIKTLVHRPGDNKRKLTNEEKEWVKSLVLRPKIKKTEYNDDDGRKEYKREKSKMYYEKKQMDRKNVNLNLRFMKADPNKVLSIDEITNDPYVSNFSQREQYKIDLWKHDKNPDYLEMWEKMYEEYKEEVEELSIEYKENFLKGVE